METLLAAFIVGTAGGVVSALTTSWLLNKLRKQPTQPPSPFEDPDFRKLLYAEPESIPDLEDDDLESDGILKKVSRPRRDAEERRTDWAKYLKELRERRGED